MPSSERKVARECVTEGACATLVFRLLYYNCFSQVTHSPSVACGDSSLPEGAFPQNILRFSLVYFLFIGNSLS